MHLAGFDDLFGDGNKLLRHRNNRTIFSWCELVRFNR